MTTEDLEKHRLAALAAGYKFEAKTLKTAPNIGALPGVSRDGITTELWNPTFNTEQTMWLAIDAGIDLKIKRENVLIEYPCNAMSLDVLGMCVSRKDKQAIRKCVFDAAVRIGKIMESQG